jgi:hypothetical protein
MSKMLFPVTPSGESDLFSCSLIKAQGKLGNIVVETFVILDVSSNVSTFAHPWKHCCGNKICFPRSENVS